MRLTTLAKLLAAILGVTTAARADTSVQALMKQKLESAHAILDAIALGDFAKIETYAGRLKDVSKVTTWYRTDAEDFLLFAKSFQNSAEFLAERAHDKDKEGVAMGYIRVTLDCLRCHDAIRAKPPKK